MSARGDVERLLALLPMSDDGTGHVAACGWTDEAPTCGCYSLPGRVRDLLAEVRAETLRATANRWTQGAWANVMLPKPTPPAVPVIAYANRFGDWLRAEAEARP